MTIHVYAGYYEIFVTPKELEKPYMHQGTFESVKEAETFIANNFDVYDNVYYERSIYPQSEYAETLSFLSDAEQEKYRFDVTDNGLVLQAMNK